MYTSVTKTGTSANRSSLMETETMQKNGASLKSLMSRRNFKGYLLFVTIFLLTSLNLFGQELISRGNLVTASKTRSGYPASRITDGDISKGWQAGDYPPQWVQIDLQNYYDISRIELVPNVTPSGIVTRQKISVSEDSLVWNEIENKKNN